mmetsp:Transcript_55272/g.124519  ORF Transcript_55272/g.124519 Transcript_55272/m.124519 type:complete len:109 (-) Transcript_55272:93-419(-)
MALLLRSRVTASLARTSPLSVLARGYGTSLPIPTPPEGSETVFSNQVQRPKYSLSNPKWFGLFFVCNIGAYMGHYFYIYWLMPSNPPNPPRNPDEVRPEKHMHTVDED